MDHGFNLKKIKTATTVFLRKFWQLNFVVRVLSFLDYLLSSSMCEPWSNKYKNTLKNYHYTAFFCRKCVADVGQSWNHTEICWGNMLLLLQHCSKIKTIWFFCNVAATPFYVASSNNLETTLGHLHLFLALSTQHITLQAPEKSFKSPLRLSKNVNCQNVLLWFTFIRIVCIQQLPGKDIPVHNQQ